MERLWSDVLSNLRKDVGKRDCIVLSSVNSEGLSSTEPAVTKVCCYIYKVSLLSQDIIAFTCNHHYLRRDYIGSVLPQLQSLLAQFPKPLPVAAKLIKEEYEQQSIAMGCPVCLYNNFIRTLCEDPPPVWSV